ncbi:MAG: ATP-binding protein [Bacteroidota bacterium]
MRTIQSKITFTYLLLSILVVILLGLFLSFEIERYFSDRTLAQLQLQTGVIHALIKDSTPERGVSAFSAAQLRILSSSSALRITLIDKDGRVVFESGLPDSLLATVENHGTRPEVMEARDRGIGTNTRHSVTTNEDLLYLARAVDPTTFQQSLFPNLQYIRVGISLHEVDKAIFEIRLKIALAAIIVLLVVGLTSFLIARKVSKPIVEISAIIRDIKAGNLDRKLPVRSEDEIGRLAELINEMTDKLQADIEQLKKLERIRTEFLGNVSHELRTPIFSMRGFLETLLEGAIDDKTVNRKFLQKAYQHAGQLDTLLMDLIEISRIESGEMKMSFRYFNVAGLLQQLAADVADEVRKKRQSIVVQVPAPEMMVFGDKDRLRQAISNLIDNAIKYSPEGSTIQLEAMERDSLVSVRVSDTGPGIEAEHLPRIFERFYRVDKNRSREVGGTGLGLAIVKHIIEAHGSRIVVSSEVGKGTIFSFDLKK